MLVRGKDPHKIPKSSDHFHEDDGDDLYASSQQQEQAISDSMTPGILLQQGRLAKGMTEDEVAKELQLSLRWIRDIEADEFSKAPALVYIRGYLRAYARLLGLSAHEILAAFEAMGWQESKAVDDHEWMRTIGDQSRKERLGHLYKRLLIGFLALAVVIALALVGIWWFVDQERMKGAPLSGTSSHPGSSSVTSHLLSSSPTSKSLRPAAASTFKKIRHGADERYVSRR
jgi:cytoskeletal protein RodZ